MASSKNIVKCIVPTCMNNSSGNPELKFLYVPKDARRREEWARVLNISISSSKQLVCCEQHFDLPNDASNWMHYKMMGSYIYLKPEVVPHLNLPDRVSPKSQLSDSDKKHKLQVVFIDEEYLDVPPLKYFSETTESSSSASSPVRLPCKSEINDTGANTNAQVIPQTRIGTDSGAHKRLKVSSSLYPSQEERSAEVAQIHENVNAMPCAANTMHNIETLCITCYNKMKFDETVSVHDEIAFDESPIKIFDALKQLSNFRQFEIISENLRICLKCLSMAESAIYFQNQCNKSAEKLLNDLQQPIKVVEPDTTEDRNRNEVLQVFVLENKTEPVEDSQHREEIYVMDPNVENDSNFDDESDSNESDNSLHLSFNNRHDSRTEQIIINEEKPNGFLCSYCGKHFPKQGYLNRHIQMHTGGRHFVCKICGKAMRGGMEKHYRIHKNEAQCGKSFIQKYSFKTHQTKSCPGIQGASKDTGYVTEIQSNVEYI